MQRITAADLGLTVLPCAATNLNWHFKHGGFMYQKHVSEINIVQFFLPPPNVQHYVICVWMRKGTKKR